MDVLALYQSNESTLINSGGSMDPQVEYAVKVTVTDSDTLNVITQVKLTIFYDSVGNDPSAPGTSNTQTCAIITWASGSVWSIDPSSSTTWVLVTGSCKTPTMSGTTGDWWFHFKPGKVATKSGAADNWDLYAKATAASLTGNRYARDYEMNWYGEITVNTGSVNWGTVAPGSDFSANQQTGISVNYIANGAYNEQIASSSNWTGTPSGTATLNAGGSPGANEFSLKAYYTATLGSAVLVNASPTYTAIGSGTQTAESGNTVATNTIWLKSGTPFTRATYNGTIYYRISQ